MITSTQHACIDLMITSTQHACIDLMITSTQHACIDLMITSMHHRSNDHQHAACMHERSYCKCSKQLQQHRNRGVYHTSSVQA